jgi:hypothetical protein
MRRAFELDVLACPRCHARLRLIVCITEPAIIRRVLRHLGLPADACATGGARSALRRVNSQSMLRTKPARTAAGNLGRTGALGAGTN